MAIAGFDYGNVPESVIKEKEKLAALMNPSALRRAPEPIQSLPKEMVPVVKDTSEPHVNYLPTKVVQLPEFSIRIENDILGFDFFIHEYHVLDYAIICILDKRNFNLTPKSNQQFNLVLDKQTFPVYYIGQPQYIKVFDKSLLFFLRNLDNNDN